MGLNFFRVDVFSRAENNQLLASPRDEDISALVHVSQVAGVEPAIPDGLGRGIRSVVIALHHNLAGDCDLTDRMIQVLSMLCIHDLDLDSFKRLANRAQYSVGSRSEGSGSAGFRKPVSLQHIETERPQIGSDLDIKGRAAGDQVTHFRAQQSMNLPEEYLAQVDA